MVFRNPATKMVNFKFVYPEGLLLNAQTSTTLKIYEISGRLVRSFDRTFMDNSGSIIWDGNDNSGKRVKNGIYSITISIGGYTINKQFMYLD
jgi:flagellar hook assembly protein FlgD